MDDPPNADASVGVDLETCRSMERTLLRMIGEVRDPAVEKVGEKWEERSARVELADAGLHVATHALATDVGDERIKVALVREVLKQTSLGDTCTPSDDVQAAT